MVFPNHERFHATDSSRGKIHELRPRYISYDTTDVSDIGLFLNGMLQKQASSPRQVYGSA